MMNAIKVIEGHYRKFGKYWDVEWFEKPLD
jgi:hypothetical protein